MRGSLLRIGAVFVLLPLLAAALARPPIPALPLVVGGLGAGLGFAARSALFVLLARRGLVSVTAGAPPRGPLLGNLVGALLGCAVALPFAVALDGFPRATLLCGGVAAALPGFALALRDAHGRRGPRTVSTWRWLLRDTALPAGLLAAGAGAIATWLRLASFEVVAPGELARHLGGTMFLYAVLLGLGGYLKCYAELESGLVISEAPTLRAPGPILLGAAFGTTLLLLAPLLPSLPFATVLWLKVALGFFGGGALSLLGAIQGARAATPPTPRPN